MTPPRRRRTALAAALLAVGLTTAACGGGGGAEPAPEPAASEAAVEPTPTPTREAPVDLARFEDLDRDAWAAIDRDPAAAAGRQVVVYAVVTRVFVAAAGTYAASVATSHPAGASEGTPAVLRGDPEEVGDVAPGDVLRVHAEVAGTYAGSTGGSVLLPELRVVASELVGPYDLSADVTLGAPVRGAATVVVPVTVTNSADTVMDYTVDLVATGPDGAEAAIGQARIGVLEPGQSAGAEVRMALVPADAQITLAAVTRVLP
jgi:hypothetical protein